MSVEAIAWALNLDDDRLVPAQRLLLVGIANHDGDGGAWPSIDTLARYVGVDPRTVQRHRARLVELGYLTVHVQQGGTARTPDAARPNLYVLHRVTPTSPGDTHVTPPGDTHVTPRVTPMSPEPSVNHPVEQSIARGDVLVDVESDFMIAARQLVELQADLVERCGYKRPSGSDGAVRDMERLLRLDGHDRDEVERVIRWLAEGRHPVAAFWQPNVRTPAKLREHWDTMSGQVRRHRDQNRPWNGESTIDRVRNANRGDTHDVR